MIDIRCHTYLTSISINYDLNICNALCFGQWSFLFTIVIYNLPSKLYSSQLRYKLRFSVASKYNRIVLKVRQCDLLRTRFLIVSCYCICLETVFRIYSWLQ